MAQEIHLYAGTYSERGSEGIYVFRFNGQAGTLLKTQTINTPTSPSFIALHPSGKYLYSANRGSIASKQPDWGSVSAFEISPDGTLRHINDQLSGDRSPCHITINPSGNMAYLSHYVGGSITTLPINNNGHLLPVNNTIRHTGSGADSERQNEPHVHSVTVSPDNRFIYVADLGTDKVTSYPIDEQGNILPIKKKEATSSPGSG
ncbi:MAG: lactonase family protein, partial [Cyclobacteriaceae bacterium]|nr:lactonase family protein [Cyclobacteriaceae bacterium]